MVTADSPASGLPQEAVDAAAEAIEDGALTKLGRDLGTLHRNDIVAAGLTAALPILRERWEGEVQADFNALAADCPHDEHLTALLAAEQAKVAGLREAVDKVRELHKPVHMCEDRRGVQDRYGPGCDLAARVDVPRLLDALDEAEQRVRATRPNEPEAVTIRFDSYQAANLRAMVKAAYLDADPHPTRTWNTGDWVGELYWLLHDVATDVQPNPRWLPGVQVDDRGTTTPTPATTCADCGTTRTICDAGLNTNDTRCCEQCGHGAA